MQIFDPTLLATTAADAPKKSRKKKKPEVETPAQHRGRDGVDITPRWTHGNKVVPTLGGRASMEEVEKTVAAAKTSVQVELYRLGYDKVIDLLAAQARAGIKVQVLLDPTPGYDPRDTADQERIQNYLTEAGVEILKYPIEKSGKIDHVKLLIIDGQKAVIGGLNWDDHSPYNLDMNVSVEGPAVEDLSNVFANDWKISGGGDTPKAKPTKPTLAADEASSMQVITTDEGREDIREAVMRNIDSAEKSIKMFCFALADKQVIEGLIAAKERGVDVKVLLDPNKPMSYVNAKAERTLQEAGIPCHYLKVDVDVQEKLHAKAALFDEDKVILGSANFTNMGLTVNHEADVEVISKAVGPALNNFFDDLWNNRSIDKLPNLPDFQEMAPDASYGEIVSKELFGWWNDTYHPDEKRNWVGKRKEAILSAMEEYGTSERRAPADAPEEEQMGALAAFLQTRQVWEITPAPGSYEKIWKARVDIAKAAETTVPQDADRLKQGMIDMVKTPALKECLRAILESAPEGFYMSPSSATGKYHPADETRYVDVKPSIDPVPDEEKAKYPGGGLVLHSRRNMELAAHLCDYYGIEGKQRDEVLMGLSLHDILKYVSMEDLKDWKPGQPVPWGQYTTKDHAHAGAEFVKRLDPSPNAEVTKEVRRYIDMHMGAWNFPEPTPPKDDAEKVISLADYLASARNFYVKV